MTECVETSPFCSLLRQNPDRQTEIPRWPRPWQGKNRGHEKGSITFNCSMNIHEKLPVCQTISPSTWFTDVTEACIVYSRGHGRMNR